MTVNNPGKIFEAQFKKCAPEYCLVYRIPDPPQAFLDGLRFSIKNPFDYILWDSKKKHLFALELKSVQDSYITFERYEDAKGTIHWHQIEGLTKWGSYDGIIAGLVIEFRKIETTIFLPIDEFNRMVSLVEKRSFNFSDLSKYNVKYKVIPQELMRTKYKYDIENFLNSFKENK